MPDINLKKPLVDHKAFKLTAQQAKVIRILVEKPGMANFKAYQFVYGTKSDASAMAGVSRLLSKTKAKDYRDALEGAAAHKAVEKMAITQERLLKEEACIAFADIGALVNEEGFFIQNLKDLPEEVRRNIAGLEISEKVDPTTGLSVPYYKLKFNDKGASLRRLEQHMGMLNQKVEVGVEVTLKGLIAHIDGKKTGQPMIPHLGDGGDKE